MASRCHGALPSAASATRALRASSRRRRAPSRPRRESRRPPIRPESRSSRARPVAASAAKDVARARVSEREKAESLRVQRDLARRLMDAQTGWVRAPGAAKKRAKTTSREDDEDPTSSSARAPTTTRGEGDDDDEARDDDNDDDASDASVSPPTDEYGTVADEAWTRGQWLLGLLVLQSTSSVVLQNYEVLVRENIVITLFLTMLVGAGGNAGNQSAIRVIRGLATGEMTPTFACFKATVWRQARVGLLLATGLGAGGFARVLITELSMNAGASLTASDVIASDVAQQTPVVGAAAIATSLFVIVTMSTVTGSAMPFALAAAGQDPANAGTTIQVAMDIAGVVITCAVCAVVFSHAGGVDVVQGSLVAGLGGG